MVRRSRDFGRNGVGRPRLPNLVRQFAPALMGGFGALEIRVIAGADRDIAPRTDGVDRTVPVYSTYKIGSQVRVL